MKTQREKSDSCVRIKTLLPQPQELLGPNHSETCPNSHPNQAWSRGHHPSHSRDSVAHGKIDFFCATVTEDPPLLLVSELRPAQSSRIWSIICLLCGNKAHEMSQPHPKHTKMKEKLLHPHELCHSLGTAFIQHKKSQLGSGLTPSSVTSLLCGSPGPPAEPHPGSPADHQPGQLDIVTVVLPPLPLLPGIHGEVHGEQLVLRVRQGDHSCPRTEMSHLQPKRTNTPHLEPTLSTHQEYHHL